MINASDIREYFEYDAISGRFFHLARSYKGSKECGTVNKRKHSSYAVLSIKLGGRYRKIYAHRAAWMYTFGDIHTDDVIDHIDGNGLNNRIENLRLVSRSLNQRNRKNKLSQRDLLGVYKHRGGFVVNFLGNYTGWTKDYFEACCARKSLEARNGFI